MGWQRIQRAQGRRGVEVSLRAPAPADLPPALQVVVLRLVQEALSNVVRHAIDMAAVVRALVEELRAP